MTPQDPFERLTILERAQFLSDSAQRRHAQALDRDQQDAERGFGCGGGLLGAGRKGCYRSEESQDGRPDRREKPGHPNGESR